MAKITLTQRIKAKCTECIYDEFDTGNGGVLAQIEACTAKTCPLYEVRPLTGKTKAALKQEKINNVSPEERLAYEAKASLARQRLLGVNQ